WLSKEIVPQVSFRNQLREEAVVRRGQVPIPGSLGVSSALVGESVPVPAGRVAGGRSVRNRTGAFGGGRFGRGRTRARYFFQYFDDWHGDWNEGGRHGSRTRPGSDSQWTAAATRDGGWGAGGRR